MLTKQMVEELAAKLETALDEVTDTGEAVVKAAELVERTTNVLLREHIYVGKNADARKLEREALLTEAPVLEEAQAALAAADRKWSLAKNELEVVRAEIKLWTALAYQLSGVGK